MNLTSEDARNRIRRVLQFLKQFQTLKTPPVRSMEEYRWRQSFDGLPRHPSVSVGQLASAADASGAVDGLILRIGRPLLTNCPAPPTALQPWLVAGWQKINVRVEWLPARNETVGESTRTIRFEDEPLRVELRGEWLKRRAEWIAAETPARQAEALYQRVYALYGEIERESENLQLMLGDGILSVTDEVGRIEHPVLLQRLELRFVPGIPEFTFAETDDPPELAMPVLGSIQAANTVQLAQCQDELTANPRIHPLGGQETGGFLARLVNGVFQNGCFVNEDAALPDTAELTIRRARVMFLASRAGSFTTAIDAALQRLLTDDEFVVPPALARLVGVTLSSDAATTDRESTAASRSGTGANQVDGERDLLLTRPANPEQEQVIRRVDQTGMVLVQGPPGTGKTHTIANLIGHALAHGKTVLVTSHTAKALRVVREKIVPELQPLCVSLLDTDESSRKELKEAVTAISQKLGTRSQMQLDAEVATLAAHRTEVVRRISAAEEALRQAVRDEYVDIVVAGEGTNPAQAARLLAEWQFVESWMSGPVELGAGLPLSTDEISELYRTNELLTEDDERELAGRLPDRSKLPSASELAGVLSRIQELSEKLGRHGGDQTTAGPIDRSEIEAALQWFGDATRSLNTEPEWYRACVEASIRGETAVAAWSGLIQCIQQTCAVAEESQLLALGQRIHELPDRCKLRTLTQVCEQIEKHLQNGGAIGFLQRIFKPDWVQLLDWRFDGRRLNSVEDFRTIGRLAQTELQRASLVERWQRQLGTLGLDWVDDGRNRPEEYFQQFVPRFQEALEWNQRVGSQAAGICNRIGVRWLEWLQLQIPVGGPQPAVSRWVAAAEHLLPVLNQRLLLLELAHLKTRVTKIVEHLRTVIGAGACPPVVQQLLNAIQSQNVTLYDEAVSRLDHLAALKTHYHRRLNLLARLAKSAPAWAAAVERRQGAHRAFAPPGDVQRAWLYRQWSQELDRRGSTDCDALQHTVNDLTEQLHDVTTRYVVSATWAEQMGRRYSLPLQQALQGWLQTITKPGFATGVRSTQLKAQARRQLRDARHAVPVWIMPLSRVVESFDFRQERFDIVIIDEASQCDVLGLLAKIIAKDVVVVGDHEQVSPSAVGQNLGQIQALIDLQLQGIPNKENYDGRTSIYDLAMTCVGSTIRLIEHFRCVPEIIQFSNSLCYGDIKPLRESHDTCTRPFVVEHRVGNGVSHNKINEVEALEVASLLVSASEQPEYADLTMGVVSLVGNEQARFIETLLRRHLKETEYARRRVLCGNAAEFQGDERHVMFLSMVDSSDGTPLQLRQAQSFRQRFNVAASRAQSQMWVVHSLNPDTELQSGDLRMRLIQHAQDPAAMTRQMIEASRRIQSEFERRVIQILNDHGYRLKAQWEVGAFSIDVVVIGSNGRKVAIECDGDRFHTQDHLEADNRRQLMLERLGWRFIRIRSSKFFRDPQVTMERVFQRISQLDVEPIGAVAEPIPDVADSELRSRVVRRAEELRREWERNLPEPGEQKVSREAERAILKSSGRRRPRVGNAIARETEIAPLAPLEGTDPDPDTLQDGYPNSPLVSNENDGHNPAPVQSTPAENLPKGDQRDIAIADGFEARESWQMTLADWRRICGELRARGDDDRLTKLGGQTNQDYAHFRRVQIALKEGKPVPSEVLRDYPQLLPAKHEPRT